MNRYGRLLGNSAIFAIGNLGSKMMQFIMIPLYSYTLTTSQYGKVDLLTTIVSLLVPITSLAIFDAVFRYALDEDDNHQQTFTIGAVFIFVMGLVTFLVALFLQSKKLGYPVLATDYVLTASTAFSLVSNYARAINRIREFAVAGILNSFAMAGLNIWLLWGLHWQMTGYLISMGTGMLVAIGYLIYSCQLWNDFQIQSFTLKKLKVMLHYSIPLVPNLLAWWLNTASDRVFILAILGASANGIYAMATKIPNVLSILMGIFIQSWQISVVQEYGGKQGKEFITTVFQAFNTVMFILAIGLVAFVKPIFTLMVSHSYYYGWQTTPLLLLAVIYSNLASFLGSVYTATKKTTPIMYTMMIGGIINVALSLLLIPWLRLVGAALANVVSLGVVTYMRGYQIAKIGQIKVDGRYLLLLHALFLVCGLVNYFSGEVLPVIIGGIVLSGMFLFDPNAKSIWQQGLELLKRRY